jgi:hypothetical protein
MAINGFCKEEGELINSTGPFGFQFSTGEKVIISLLTPGYIKFISCQKTIVATTYYDSSATATDRVQIGTTLYSVERNQLRQWLRPST